MHHYNLFYRFIVNMNVTLRYNIETLIYTLDIYYILLESEGDNKMSNCPECNKRLIKEKRELSPGVYADVEICSKCEDEWIDKDEYERLRSLFKRKVFKIGGSLAVRIPKEIADAVGLHDGDELNISIADHKVVIDPTTSS